MKYTFSEEIKTQRYGTGMYAIMEGERIVAYSEVKFEIPDKVRFFGSDQAYIFKGAKIAGGNFSGGNFRGGDFSGGNFWGGNFWGGDFRGGNFSGGDFWGGNYAVTLLQIQGSRHFCYLEKTDEGRLLLCIGCHKYTIDEWKEQYSQIGANENYSLDEIAEYKEYILMYDRLYQPKKKTSKKVEK